MSHEQQQEEADYEYESSNLAPSRLHSQQGKGGSPFAAHFSDIVTGEIDGNFSGYDLAGWTGFNVVPIVEIAKESPDA
jgi:hypothetical protein